jgi:hypothetical protein
LTIEQVENAQITSNGFPFKVRASIVFKKLERAFNTLKKKLKKKNYPFDKKY